MPEECLITADGVVRCWASFRSRPPKVMSGERQYPYISARKRHSESWGMGAEHPIPMRI